ncbi:hypothetical protein ASE74_05655 [Pedobacter sp. Leaf216]|nr:hypothetical protein ASE74_05655 [Pedobacter sp. Leaf216]
MSSAVTIPVSAVAGTAQLTSDYSNVPASVTFAAGTVLNASGIATQAFTVTIVNDNISEPTENYTVSIGTPTGPALLGTTTSQITTINDNDFATVAITPTVSVGEANGPATFTVTLTGAVQNAFTVTYSTANGTATAGSDYTGSTNATISFPANSASGAIQTISIPVINDNIAEADETFTVTLNGTSIGTQVTIPAATSTGTATIIDNDRPVATLSGDATVTEGTNAVANYTVTLTGAANTTLSSAVTIPVSAVARGNECCCQLYRNAYRSCEYHFEFSGYHSCIGCCGYCSANKRLQQCTCKCNICCWYGA